MKSMTVLTVTLLFLSALFGMAQQKKPEVRWLTPGQSVDHELKSGETQTYSVKFAQGDVLQLAVDPRGIGATLTLSAPDGRLLVTGEEFLSYIAAADGSYTLEIKGSGSDKSGRYVLQVDGPRAATERDRKNLEAERIFAEGMTLADNNSEGAQKVAIGKFQAALSIYQEIKDRRGEARALNSLGMAHDYLNLFEKAGEYYQQALLIRHELRDRSSEAVLNTSLSFVYYHLQQYDKAREYTEKSLIVYKEINDKEGERETLNNLSFVDKKLKELNKSTGGNEGKPDRPASEQAGKEPKAEKSSSGGGGRNSSLCTCRELICNANRCWWHYYYCYC